MVATASITSLLLNRRLLSESVEVFKTDLNATNSGFFDVLIICLIFASVSSSRAILK
jgi:hypothetical protein